MENVPGSNVVHVVISDDSRRIKGSMAAFDAAVDRMRNEYAILFAAYSTGKGAKFHLVLSFERPQSS